MRPTYALIFVLLISVVQGFGKTVVFFENGFPTVDNGEISRATLERAMAPMNPVFVGLDSLSTKLAAGDLLVLPYGSAFPADTWGAIIDHLRSDNLLVIGGRPLCVPVYRNGAGWRAGTPQNSYSKNIGIMYSYAAPQHGPWTLNWDVDAPFFRVKTIDASRVFVNAGFGGSYRGLCFFVGPQGDRLAAPVAANDMVYFGQPRRGVYLSFDAKPVYWESQDGTELIREAARYASFGGLRVYLDIDNLSLDPGDRVTGSIDVLRGEEPATLTVELRYGSILLEKRSMDCGSSLHESLALTQRLKKPGLYTVRAVMSMGDTVFEQYTSGVEVRQAGLLESGQRLEARRDYFQLNGRPFLPVGVNYFSTDPHGRAFFVGQSIGGNPYIWERDFAAMERDGLTIVRTGIWANRLRYLEQVSGASSQRLLNAIEAYLDAAARHHMQVIFTFFAFNPGVEFQTGRGPGHDVMVMGSNPYVDPTSVKIEETYVRSIASRFKDVPFLSYDLINEPSYSDIEHIWKGNSPSGGPAETMAWQKWLEDRYVTIDSLAGAWHVPPAELGSFDKVQLPDYNDIQQARDNNAMNVRAVDYNHFAQQAFNNWTNDMIRTIRSTGSTQAITVGQDEGGVTNRLLDQFIAESDVTYTVNHTWWQDDALLWDSVVPKTTGKPNLVEETGPQPVWTIDGRWRLDDMNGLGLEERKLVLAFANAGAGVLHWDWTHSDDFGLMRSDGSQKVWMDVLKGIASFAREAEPYTTEARLPEIALVLPQALQLSTFNSYGIEVQQKAVRALYQYARGSAFAIGEYQLAHMPAAKLIIVPAPWVLSEQAWDELTARVKAGATLLISGRIDANSHWQPVPERTSGWNVDYSEEALRTRYAEVSWPGDSARLSYSGDKTTYLDRGVLGVGRTFADITLGKGRILYFALPLEMSDELSVIGRVYKFAMQIAGVEVAYTTTCNDPGKLIAPTQLPEGTLYVLTSESANSAPLQFHDILSGADLSVNLENGRGALVLVARNGKVAASYNMK
jgi:Beta-galactosidase